MAKLTITDTVTMRCGTQADSKNLIERRVLKADFAIRDEKGRAVGGIAYISDAGEGWADETFTCPAWYPVPGEVRKMYTHRFSVGTQAARDGERFGASTGGTKGFNTNEEAVAYAMKQLGAQAARYAKKYAVAA